MPTRTMDETMEVLSGHLDDIDGILRVAHNRFRAYRPEDLVELDARAQASCTYAHAVAEADRRLLGRTRIKPIEIRGLKLWLLEDANVALRLKKMDEDGTSRNYPTKQAKDYDAGRELPGLPMPPVRLTAGYVLDETGASFLRSQVARPSGKKNIMWCAAIIPTEVRKAGERPWHEVIRGMSY